MKSWLYGLFLVAQLAAGLARKVTACERAAQWTLALALLTTCEGAQPAVQPDVVTFNSLIVACGRANETDFAFALRTMMAARRIEPNTVTINALISACERVRRWDAALELLQGMQLHALRPDTVTLSAAISACEKARTLLDFLSNLEAELKADEIGSGGPSSKRSSTAQHISCGGECLCSVSPNLALAEFVRQVSSLYH